MECRNQELFASIDAIETIFADIPEAIKIQKRLQNVEKLSIGARSISKKNLAQTNLKAKMITKTY
jgi:hypothetical protein